MIRPASLTIPDRITLAFLFFFVLGISALMAPYGICGFVHESVLFKPAIDVVEGKMLYRDTFTQYGALSVLLHAAAISLFGRYVLSVKYLVGFTYALTGIFLWLTWRRFLNRTLSTLGIVIWTLLAFFFNEPFQAWPSSYALFFQSLSLLFLVAAVEKNKIPLFWAAGAMAAAVFFCKQNVGAYLFIAELIGLHLLYRLERTTPLAPRLSANTKGLLVGFFSVFSLFILWFSFNGALRDWWLQSLVWPKEWAKEFGNNLSVFTLIRCLFLPHAAYSPRDTRIYDVLLPTFCLVTSFRSYSLLKEGRSSLPLVALFLTSIVGIASWLQYHPIQGASHLWWASAPMFGVAFYCLNEDRIRFFAKKRTWGLAILSFVIAGLFLPHIVVNTTAAIERMHSPTVTVPGHGPLAGLKLSPVGAEGVSQLEAVIEERINAKFSRPEILLFGTIGVPLFFVKNAHFFHPMWPTAYTLVITAIYPDFPKQLDNYIRRENPIVFVGEAEARGFQNKWPHYQTVAEIQVPENEARTVFIFEPSVKK